MSSFGATARAWRSDRLGIQLAFTRDAMTSDVAAGRVTSIRFEPGVVYALFDHVSDYVWIRPYVGSVLSLPSPDVEGLGARRHGARVGQRHWISRLRRQRADVRGRAAVRAERGARIPSIPDAVPRIRGRSAERVDRRTLVHQVRRAPGSRRAARRRVRLNGPAKAGRHQWVGLGARVSRSVDRSLRCPDALRVPPGNFAPGRGRANPRRSRRTPWRTPACPAAGRARGARAEARVD